MLKNLVTAAFGKSTLESTSTLLPPVSIDDHPDWLQHQRQRDELATALAVATDHVSRLPRERVHDVHEAMVRQLLDGDNVATIAPDAVAVDAAITTGQARVATIAEALKRLDARGADLRHVIMCELYPPIEAAARELVKKLAKSLRDAAAISDELAVLERFERYDLVAVPVHRWHELSLRDEYSRLSRWLADAQTAGWDA